MGVLLLYVRGEIMGDWISCSYCGIVPRGHHCTHKPKAKPKESTEIRRFRNTQVWVKKSAEIKTKARYLCEVCMDDKYNTINQFNFSNLETHHIEPISDNYNRRLDNYNLIVLCQQHHKMAEKNDIPRDYLFKLAEKRENEYPPL